MNRPYEILQERQRRSAIPYVRKSAVSHHARATFVIWNDAVKRRA
jgi:hypothetical protein